MDILDFLVGKFNSELVDRFKELAEKQKIPLDLFRDEANQEVLARYISGELADSLMNTERENAWLDVSVYSYILHILGAETAGEIIANAKLQPVASVGLTEAVAVNLTDID